MMRNILKLKFLCLFAAILAYSGVSAQGLKDVRINEVLVKNIDSFMDDYGHRSGWIELHNTGYSNVNLAGNYLSVRRGDKTLTYKIPKNDPRTNIPPQGYLVFFADGEGSKGTFYTNFTLDQTGEIYLIDASGRGPAIDSVKYDINALKEDVSVGWFTQVQKEPSVWGELSQTTPASTNDTIEFESRAEIFRERDPYGIVMVITAMSVVFIALILLYQVFKRVGKYMVGSSNKKDKKQEIADAAARGTVIVDEDEEVPGEVIAAIALALKNYEMELLSLESTIITINRVARNYSPWSSKIYGVNNQPNKR